LQNLQILAANPVRACGRDWSGSLPTRKLQICLRAEATNGSPRTA